MGGKIVEWEWIKHNGAEKTLRALEEVTQKLNGIEDYAKETTQAFIEEMKDHIKEAKLFINFESYGNAEEEIKQAAKTGIEAGEFAMKYEWLPGMSETIFDIAAKLYGLVGDETSASDAMKRVDFAIDYKRAPKNAKRQE